ncbi:MAG: CaiB/BaiF CoA transferase family protein [Dehalococcoidia bacterium]
MGGPLDGISVLEVANWLAAPATAALLADMGAEVVKVEPPQGDPWRHFLARSLGFATEFDINYAFELDNRGKRSITLDLSKEKATEVVLGLAEKADVFITNLVPRRLERFRLRYQDLSPRNPKLIYLSFSGYGDRGPEKDRLGFDYAAFWARSGIMSLVGEPDAPPAIQRGGMGDHTSCLAMAAGVLAALFERERTGKGQEICGSLLNIGLWVLGSDLQAALIARENPARHARTAAPMPMWNSYRTKDDKWIMLVNPSPDPYWPRVCAALERKDLGENPEYNTIEGLMEHCQELVAQFDETFATKTKDEWGRILDENGVIWAPVQEIKEVMSDPQVQANSYLTTVEHPTYGKYQTIDTPIRFRSSEVRARGPAPEIGQHTEEVLLENGYSWEEITDLRDQGVI